MRMLLYAGKGGVGKTCVAGATGIITARAGLKTLVMSLDPAHSLSDAFDLDRSLMDKNRGQPIQAGDDLWVQELDVHEEINNYWSEVHSYISLLLNTSGIDDILAEELAVLPGMEELSALLYINKYVKDQLYDVIVLDCAPTAESIRFISMPTAMSAQWPAGWLTFPYLKTNISPILKVSILASRELINCLPILRPLLCV
jgi:arsenite-transporting ATPase